MSNAIKRNPQRSQEMMRHVPEVCLEVLQRIVSEQDVRLQIDFKSGPHPTDPREISIKPLNSLARDIDNRFRDIMRGYEHLTYEAWQFLATELSKGEYGYRVTIQEKRNLFGRPVTIMSMRRSDKSEPC